MIPDFRFDRRFTAVGGGGRRRETKILPAAATKGTQMSIHFGAEKLRVGFRFATENTHFENATKKKILTTTDYF